MKTKITDRQRLFEIGAVILTGAGKFVFMDWLNWRLFYIATACLFWIAYVIYRKRRNDGILQYWGFTMTGFKENLKVVLPVAMASGLLLFLLGYYQDTLILSWHIFPILLIYPIWGVIQQFLMVGLIAGNLQDMEDLSISKPFIILITAIIFSVVHFPFLLLVGGTFLLALFYTFLYLKKKNLWVLGIFHGWLGAFFFYFILERDPWLEVFFFFK